MVEYCSSDWMPSVASHLRLLQRVVSKKVRLTDGLVVCGLEKKRRDATLCKFNMIHCNPIQALAETWLEFHVHARLTVWLDVYLDVPRSRTVLFIRSFYPACKQHWNSLDEPD